LSANFAITRPPDKSLEAYKAWINNMAAALGVEGEEPTDAEWEAMWREFWAESENKK
jgi:hypothetical protein